MAEFKGSKQTEIEIYTDGSRDQNNMHAAAVINKNVFSVRLPDETTIFSAEAKGIELAFEHIKMSKYTHLTIFSDSFSFLQSLHSMNINRPYILDILSCFQSR